MTYTLTIHGPYGNFTETHQSLEGVRLRATALYGDLPVTINDNDGKEYRRYGFGSV